MSPRARLLFLVDSPTVADGSIATGVLDVAGHLDPDLFEVHLALIDGSTPVPSGDMVLPKPFHRIAPPTSFWRWHPLCRLAMARLLRELCPDAVCVRGVFARLLGLDASRRAGIPLRLALVDDLGHDLTPPLVRSLRSANRGAGRFITDTHAAARRLMRQEGVERGRIDIISPGIDCATQPDRSPDGIADAKHRLGLSMHEPVIVMSAPFQRGQDHATFLAAAAQLIRHQPDARFILLGTGTREAVRAIRHEIHRLRLDDRVTLSGSTDSLPLWLAAADVAVLTSYTESGSPALLRYMAAGLPIVAVNVGGNGELVRHGEEGYLVDFRDSDQLAIFIFVLLLSPELASRLGQAAFERAQSEFSLTRARRAYADYFYTIVQTHLIS
ncbi:MAG: glycosyltransferase family 4 protein [candidate division Zixibacteria bacterium]|nr:glycosyltransferase family 4 protein [candidate division Zixibacteria bacterium]